ncbi:putative ribosome-binding factor A, mitochondrial [Antedon mediterranea]|uniref:putative ribosome-binding factor A, mitochondrial n=1 Tax=Antedon mediterranea TaxID=105859 RepID=UPI003AF81E79
MRLLQSNTLLFTQQIPRCFSIYPLLMKRSQFEKMTRLLVKKRKQFYFDVNNPTQFTKSTNKTTSRKSGQIQPEDNIRLRCLNDNLFQHVSDFINSDMISEELGRLNVQILGVRLAGDLRTCHVYWQASGNVESDDKVQEVLDKYAFTIRHMLATLRILNRTPIMVFTRDKASANIAEVERLLDKADMGPADSEDIDYHQLPAVEDMPPIQVHSQQSLNFLNMDLGKINQEIEKYKKKSSNITDVSESQACTDINKSFEQFKVLQRKKKKHKDRKTNPISASYNEAEEDFEDSIAFHDVDDVTDDNEDVDWYNPPEDHFNK